jgi:hypothetical protein
MHQDVQVTPLAFDLSKNGFQLSWPGDIQRHEHRSLQLISQGLDVGFGLLVEIGHRQLGTELAECPGTAIGNGVFIGDTDH